ncbi:MAG TPA: DUF6265 family protein [Allosphingosinicella sp.]|uniref:DUF6265 family protein n=1 Tax=Allosphingosinicella sp. TaxID=2823234 RepID=UPI002EDA110D
MLLTFIAALAVASAAPAPKVEDLDWLSGDWVSEQETTWTEESWTSTRGGMLLGVNRSGKGDKGTAYDFMRIAADEQGNIVFWASPAAKAPVPFRLVSRGATEAVFENPEHDYPTRIAYRRAGNQLHATISGPEGKNPYSWTFRRR